jgi:hypothetical protein
MRIETNGATERSEVKCLGRVQMTEDEKRQRDAQNLEAFQRELTNTFWTVIAIACVFLLPLAMALVWAVLWAMNRFLKGGE